MNFLHHHARKIFGLHAANNLVQNVGAIVVLKRALYALNTSSNSFRDSFGEFIRDLGFITSITYQYLWMKKLEEYDGYDYITTHIDDIIILANNPSKYMNEIEQHLQVRAITNSPFYYLGK